VLPNFSHRIEVRFRDCDAMGHVNNAVYFTYFEQARIMMADTLGLRRSLEDTGLGLILAHASCDYKAQVLFGDVIDVRVAVTAIGRSSFTGEYEIRRVKDDSVVATGKSIQVVFDYATGKAISIPDVFREKLEAIETGTAVTS
jgi:acyl-CoA thioester hydrolase|tara:strand:+ start:51 stop:479 length:429 start_codon:yes stop_codon:yes gene_type:complete